MSHTSLLRAAWWQGRLWGLVLGTSTSGEQQCVLHDSCLIAVQAAQCLTLLAFVLAVASL
jgi:hypothetical protein